MKKIIIVAMIILSPTILMAKSNKNYIHPTFKTLLQMYPRNHKIVNPMVPRISAEHAYNLYITSKAILCAAGSIAHKAEIKGMHRIPDNNGYKSAAYIKKLKRMQKNTRIRLLYFSATERQKSTAARWLWIG